MSWEIQGVKGRSGKEVRKFLTKDNRKGIEFSVANDVYARDAEGGVVRGDDGRFVVEETDWSKIVMYERQAEKVADLIEEHGSLPIVAIGRWEITEYEKEVNGQKALAEDRKFVATDIAINASKAMSFPHVSRSARTVDPNVQQDVEVEQRANATLPPQSAESVVQSAVEHSSPGWG